MNRTQKIDTVTRRLAITYPNVRNLREFATELVDKLEDAKPKDGLSVMKGKNLTHFVETKFNRALCGRPGHLLWQLPEENKTGVTCPGCVIQIQRNYRDKELIG
jgi:hypothetical protein